MNHPEKTLKYFLIALFVFFAAGGAAFHYSSVSVKADTAGFKTTGGKTYYYDSNGRMVKGWLTIGNQKYYFDTQTGEQIMGWLKLNGDFYYFRKSNTPSMRNMAKNMWATYSNGLKRHFAADGKLDRGFTRISDNWYYFLASNGYMVTGWQKLNGSMWYFYSSGVLLRNKLVYFPDEKGYRYFLPAGRMAIGWQTFGAEKRYFKQSGALDKTDGLMAIGFTNIDGDTYYFNTSGYQVTGWVSLKSGSKCYFDPDNRGIAIRSAEKTIDGVTYVFDSHGTASVKEKEPDIDLDGLTGKRTIKNYLVGAFQPIGRALYVWGGGWTDSTRKGVSPAWTQWYASQSSSYNYNNYRDLSEENRRKGLDCSGFVGWSAYQVMHATSDELDYGYTVISGEVGPYYRSMGWGTIVTQSYLASTDYKLVAGDVGYNDDHTWICVGQCPDKSIVIVHSTPQAGVQLAGTPTPDGDYDSEAVELAIRYMSRYSGYTKYEYKPATGNYVRRGNYLRWNSSTLADPDGYRNMTAEQILADIFNS